MKIFVLDRRHGAKPEARAAIRFERSALNFLSAIGAKIDFDAYQLKTDVDVNKGQGRGSAAYPRILHFTLDAEELQLPLKGKNVV